MDRTFPTDRRTVARLVAGAAATSLAGCTSLRITFNPASGAHGATTFELGAEAGGWRGVAPTQIRGERNPILRFPTSETVEITWENLDGKPHQFVVEDSGGSPIVESATSSERGETVTLRFEASQEMTTYLDPAYPVQMRGEILVPPN